MTKMNSANLPATGSPAVPDAAYKSQKGQDRWVLEVLRNKRRGYFVELAAADGMTHSNTYVLEKYFDWQGLCIEPNPDFYAQLVHNRSCRTDPAVVDERPGEVLFRIDNGQFGGIVGDDVDNNPGTRGKELEAARAIRLSAEPFVTVLRRHAAPTVIDYLSLDVEGAEERVLRSFPFESYIFRCVTIERPTPRLNEIMLAAEYDFVKNVQFDTFYVNRSIPAGLVARGAFEQVPPKDW
ncbi:MAG TPA: FkbM family methyltransferase [Candidatus Limnocylindria bacterium]|jgi:FkbM family methyltransferase|nr:FkbM family methyltransferase [Candidatus Limnocylindria bacterium]